ncbi:MAG TPA: DUF429 domain-containing protein, partial [Methylomirabilota bacterium]|nr:DUF429 domain-containing protein [Methylomirabilota bacterium]
LMLIIGIDCATDFRNVGVATGLVEGNKLTVECVNDASASGLAELLRLTFSEGRRVLLALDAPLGWPAPLARSLVSHQAGDPLVGKAHSLFRRTTDLHVKALTGRPPLDVGADRIARTAHATLGLVAMLRESAKNPFPLVWQPDFNQRAGCIEVYPAATLWVHGLPSRGYKGSESRHAQQRTDIVKGLAALLDVPAETRAAMEDNDHLIDAAVCVQAAADFLRGRCQPPPDLELARKEGWIWVATRDE